MSIHAGGCLCAAVRYQTLTDPLRVTICHCRFCQRATGSAYMVEPIFRLEDLQVTCGSPVVYDLRSAGSGKLVHIHFCQTCGTKLYLTFERFAQTCGVYAGTFDDPDWFDAGTENSRHIYVDVARHDTVLPAHVKLFRQHALLYDGSPLEAMTLKAPALAGRRG